MTSLSAFSFDFLNMTPAQARPQVSALVISNYNDKALFIRLSARALYFRLS